MKGRPPTKQLKSSYEQSGSKSKNKNNNEHTASTTASDITGRMIKNRLKSHG